MLYAIGYAIAGVFAMRVYFVTMKARRHKRAKR